MPWPAPVSDGAGKRTQVSKGGFRTRKEAEAARVEALATLQSGTFVRPDRLTVADFLVDEWLPTQRPPTLEESTYVSHERAGRTGPSTEEVSQQPRPLRPTR
jgi:hypothetical protein